MESVNKMTLMVTEFLTVSLFSFVVSDGARAERDAPASFDAVRSTQRRLASAISALALLGAGAIAIRFLVGESRAEIENPGRDTEPRLFTSARDQIRMVVPRQWRATDQSTYPGIILWVLRDQPPGQIALTAEAFTRELYCSWPSQCRASQESITSRFACALRTRLSAQRLRVGPAQPGPKENTAAGMPSAWFEYDDGKRFLRQAVALTADRAISLVLSAPTAEGRAAHVRAFEQMLRTLRPLTADEAAISVAAAEPDAGAPTGDAGAAPPPGDASAAAHATSSPATKIDPVGPCP
jgi:hypothetical protein